MQVGRTLRRLEALPTPDDRPAVATEPIEGSAWSFPSYSVHGTPEPGKVGNTESHGGIRLTNQDVRDLATRIERGAKVTFKDE